MLITEAARFALYSLGFVGGAATLKLIPEVMVE